MRRWLLFALLLVLGVLQYQLWLGDGGWRDLQQLEQRVAVQEAENVPLRERNARMAAEVTDLKMAWMRWKNARVVIWAWCVLTSSSFGCRALPLRKS